MNLRISNGTTPTTSLEAAVPAPQEHDVPRATWRARLSNARAWAPEVAAFAAIASVSWLLFFRYAYLQYDTVYALGWGQVLANGHHPELLAVNAPTPHPLGMAFGFLSSLLTGDASYDVMLAMTPLGYALLVWAVFLLGARAFNWRVGVLGALLIATSFPVLMRAGASFFDVPAVALAVLAGAMEIKQPKRGVPVLLVLALAGLLRPEAWLLSAVYLVYLAPSASRSQLVRLALVAAIAPTLWIGMDFALTGKPLHSFVHTQAQLSGVKPGEVVDETALQAESQEGLTTKVASTIDHFGQHIRKTVRLPVIAGALIGLGLALLTTRRRLRVPLALLVLGVVSYVLLGLSGLYLVERFTFLAASMLVIFCAYAGVGWIGADVRGRLRWGWIGAGLLVLLVLAGTAPAHLETLPALRDAVDRRSAMTDDLERLTRDPVAARAFRSCSAITVQNYRGRPHLGYLIDRDPSVIDTSTNAPRSGAYVIATRRVVERDYLRHDSKSFAPLERPPFAGFQQVAHNRSFALYTKGC